jgi:hypothetical protein
MLKISSEQIRTFQPDADAAFERRVMDYLRENHAEAEIRFPHGATTVAETSDEILQEIVRGGILRASDYGIEWKSTLLSYVVVMFLTAPNFDRYSKAAQFFNETETITDEDWSQVEKNYDAAAWSLPLQTGVAV